jgi:RecA-family ATPase
LFVAKPGTAKSVLLCDIGCHIAAGREWHGRKVKRDERGRRARDRWYR